MAEELFDPYRKWLGIPPAEQPPTHYRLLGLVELEDDPDVISHAADRCMAHVRTFQTGAKSEVSQQILNELSAARRALLTPDLKSAYDAELRLVRQPLPPPPLPMGAVPGGDRWSNSAAVPLPAIPAADAPFPSAGPAAAEQSYGSTPARSAARQRARKKSSPLPLLVGVTGVMLVVVLTVLGTRNAPPEAREEEVGRAATVVKKPEPPPSPRKVPPAKPPESNQQQIKSSHEIEQRERRGDREREIGRGEFNRPAATIDEALDRARMALTRNRPIVARRQLKDAKEMVATEPQRERRIVLEKLLECLERFHRALESGAAELKPGAHFVFEKDDSPLIVTFREYDRRERLLRFDTKAGNVERRLEEIPPDWAVPIARPMLTGTDENTRLAIAAYQALHPSGNRQTAKLLWDEALAAGVVKQSLIDELQLASVEGVPTLPELKIVYPGDEVAKAEPDGDTKPEKMPEKDPAKKSAKTDETPVSRVPVPASAELVEAKRLFREVYREKISAAKSAAQRQELAAEVYQAGREVSDNPAQKYVLLGEALELAITAANAEALLPIADELGQAFELDGLQLKAASLAKAIAASSGKEQGTQLYLATLNLFNEAKEASRFDVAASVARSAANAARRAGNPKAAKLAEGEGKKMEALDEEARQKKPIPPSADPK